MASFVFLHDFVIIHLLVLTMRFYIFFFASKKGTRVFQWQEDIKKRYKGFPVAGRY